MPKNEVGPVSHATCKVDPEWVTPLNKMQNRLNNRVNCPDPRYKAPTKAGWKINQMLSKLKFPRLQGHRPKKQLTHWEKIVQIVNLKKGTSN